MEWVDVWEDELVEAYIFRSLQAPFDNDFYQCTTMGVYTEEWQERLYTIASLVTLFLLPLLIIAVSYLMIFYTIAVKANNNLTAKGEVEEQNTASLLQLSMSCAASSPVCITRHTVEKNVQCNRDAFHKC
ncbi:PREDICTED: gonadotropin-releasing hormone II receptor-like [Priapulus caudatus]|uniref:Gonadotropin-releasing hormone II receptor-like n=1 Tax=Priapulus caudatus TaxID=37621 RepID=A0ABM1DTY8_PRICU|nr:PREDICTED: gonadotropin-releasing hormone II receptor-like [Priapulus caudatus]